MKRKRSLVGWCGLGLAVAAVGGGAYAGKRYAEQHMLSTVLGSGVRTQSITWHWRQSAGCAEQVEIPLPHATDNNDQALQLYAPKLWFVYDQAALLRKRFILPRVVIEDALIATSHDRMVEQQLVDIDFGPGVDLGDLVEMPSETPSVEAPSSSRDSSSAATEGEASSPWAAKSSGMSLEWLDSLQAMCEAMQSDKVILGHQVSVDTDMLTERIQADFANSRLQAQKLIGEARDLLQLLASMDNVLRQPRLNEITRRLEMIRDELKKLKSDIDHSDKRLDEQQSRVRSALLVEKKQLLRQADEYQAPAAQQLAQAILAQMVQDQVAQPTRAVVLLADFVRRPLDAMPVDRGQQMRYLDQEPEFAARSVSISGKLELAGQAWPFTAQGNFELATAASDETTSEETDNHETRMSDDSSPDEAEDHTDYHHHHAHDHRVGHQFKPDEAEHHEREHAANTVVLMRACGKSQWQMTIDTPDGKWLLDAQCPRVGGPCTVKLSSSLPGGFRMDCQVDQTKVGGQGQIGFRKLVADGSAQRLNGSFAENYRAAALLRHLMTEALVVDDQTPEQMEFNSQHLERASRSTAPPDCAVQGEAVEWISVRLQSVATASLAGTCRQAAMRLEKLVNAKLVDQKGMVATLRKDTEQYVGAQMDELRRIQASVSSLLEQMQPNYFARQPGETTR